MKRTWWLIPCLMVVLALGAVGCSTQVTCPPPEQQTGIWVTGQGEAMATPDIAMLSLGIEVRGETVAEALEQASEAMEEVMQALIDNGVAEEDIQTQRFSIYPVTRWVKNGEDEIIAYRVTNMVLAKIREIDKAGAVIDAVAQAGGDYSRIQGISFTVDDPTPYYEEARAEAVQDAKSKAQQLASLAGVTLGKPGYISEGPVYWPSNVRGFLDYEAGAAPSTPISPGEMEITVNVQVVYAIA